MLIPTRGRTWGPKGCTPLVPYNYDHDRISALATLTVSARRGRMGLYTRFQQANFKAVHVAHFLRHLLRHLPGNIILLWDRASIHKGPALAALRYAYPRLHVAWFPGYAPELNPTEQVWRDFKRHTANSVPLDTGELHQSLHTNKRRVCRSQSKLRSFVLASDLPSPPW